MKLLERIKKYFEDRKFSRTLGQKAKLKDMEVRTYNEEMKRLMENQAKAKGKQKAHKHIKSFWKRHRFKRMILQDQGL